MRLIAWQAACGSSNQSMLVIGAGEQAWRRSGGSASMSPVQLPSWTITLVCGASGVGKSSLAISLARGYGHPLAEADDVVTAVKALTTPENAPVLHLWDSHPEAASWPPPKIAEHHFTVAEALRPGLAAIIADHLAFSAPVVLEGDYVLPDLAAGFGGAVRAVVISEDDPGQLAANFAAREPGPAQHGRAAVSILVGADSRTGPGPPGKPSCRPGPGTTWPGGPIACCAGSAITMDLTGRYQTRLSPKGPKYGASLVCARI